MGASECLLSNGPFGPFTDGSWPHHAGRRPAVHPDPTRTEDRSLRGSYLTYCASGLGRSPN